MKFRIQIAHENNINGSWWENYNTDDIINNEPRPSTGPRRLNHNKRPRWENDPTQWGRNMVEWFNSVLRPTEKRRVFLKAEEMQG